MIELRDNELHMLAEYMIHNFGINVGTKRTLVQGRLNNYLVQRGFEDYESYLRAVFSDGTGREASQLIGLLTTNYSYFMREQEHFQYFRDHILPGLKKTVKDKDLRVWSAGCSTGEEPYSLAMLLSDFLGDEKIIWDWKILATDISENVLRIAKKGIYDQAGLENVPAIWRLNYFDRLPDHRWQVKKELRSEVIFGRFNLMQNPFPFRRRFHAIFCRNVMIYFDTQAKNRLIDRFYDALEPGGHLFIGHSESINREGSNFTFVRPSIFQKVG